MEDPKDILKKIINNEGNCDWTTPAICSACPMSRLKKSPNGSYLGCLEAVGAASLPNEEANKKYQDKALEMLIEAEIEGLLKGDE
jgi:hypothetical protein